MQYDRRAAVAFAVGLLHRILGRSVAAPVHALAAVAVGAGEDLDLVGHHERRVEAQSEVTYDGLVLILGEELLRARECDLVYVAVDLLGIHSYASVGDGEGLLVGVDADADGQVAPPRP